MKDKKENLIKMKKIAEDDLNNLNLNWNDLKGKTTLDLGAGEGIIGKVAERKNIDVISLDNNPEMWKEMGKELPKKYVKASAEKLPFEDNTFDLIISIGGPLNLIGDKKILTNMIKEAERVLKKGGEVRFGMGPANVFKSEELFTPEEEKSFSVEERIKRIGEKSLAFLKKINPNVIYEDIKDKRIPLVVSKFYILKK